MNSFVAGMVLGASGDDLKEGTFNGDFVPQGWSTEPDLYRKVVGPYGRVCHAQRLPSFAKLDDFNALMGIITILVLPRLPITVW